MEMKVFRRTDVIGKPKKLPRIKYDIQKRYTFVI